METPQSKSELTLPIDIASDALTLEEIGALVVIMASPNLPKGSEWPTSQILADHVSAFMREGILTTELDEESGDIELNIDLTWV